MPGDQAPKHYELVMGANHNFYNTVWSPFECVFREPANDWLAFVPGGQSDSHCGSGKTNQRLTEAQQRGTGLAYMTAFFRAYVGGESQFIPILTGDAPPPPSAQTNNLFVSYHAPAASAIGREQVAERHQSLNQHSWRRGDSNWSDAIRVVRRRSAATSSSVCLITSTHSSRTRRRARARRRQV